MLYRTYRPQIFHDVVGQEHVTRSLRGGLSGGRISHAYLFAGPRGTGKTTVARVFAKALNCEKRGKTGEPDNTCSRCQAVNEGRSLDLIEIDAASNRGIDEIRNIKESAGVASLGGGHKVFLIDEVHMLTKDAFNALLKILEEPPSHVVFIMATTEPHKILPTVLSRVQRFDFKKLTHAQIMGKLKAIATKEKVSIDEDGLLALAVSSDGAMRDAEVALSKVLAASAKPSLSVQDINDILGLIPFTYHAEFLGLLAAQDRAGAISFLQRTVASGIDAEHFAREFIDYVRKTLIMRINPVTLAEVGQNLVGEHAATMERYAQSIDPNRLVRILTLFMQARNQIKTAPIAQLPLELAVMELCTQ